MPNTYAPKPEHKFSFGLWTVSNRGRDPFGDVVRPPLSPNDAAAMLGEVGAWGVNLHDNDLVPIDATPAERDKIVKEFQAACTNAGIVVPMATVNLFYDPVFRDGAFTATLTKRWKRRVTHSLSHSTPPRRKRTGIDEPVQHAVRIVADVDLAGHVLAERADVERRVEQHARTVTVPLRCASPPQILPLQKSPKM